jgi:hypothetical protein
VVSKEGSVLVRLALAICLRLVFRCHVVAKPNFATSWTILGTSGELGLYQPPFYPHTSNMFTILVQVLGPLMDDVSNIRCVKLGAKNLIYLFVFDMLTMFVRT